MALAAQSRSALTDVFIYFSTVKQNERVFQYKMQAHSILNKAAEVNGSSA